MQRALGLRHGALNLSPLAPVRLGPLPICDADLAALDLDRRDAHIRPEDQEVNLVLGAAISDLDRMGKDAVIREAFP